MTREQLDHLAEQIISMNDKDRSYLWEQLMKKICGTCGETKDGACWGCYDSRGWDE